MASTPDAHPDSIPDGPAEDPERVTPPATPDRENVENIPGGDSRVNHHRDRDVAS